VRFGVEVGGRGFLYHSFLGMLEFLVWFGLVWVGLEGRDREGGWDKESRTLYARFSWKV